MADIASAVIGGGALLLDIYNSLTKKSQSSNNLDICPTLHEAMAELLALRDDRELWRLNRPNRRNMSNTYDTWVREVNELEMQANRLRNKHEERQQRSKILRNPFSKLNKQMRKKTLKALRLYKHVVDVILIERPPECAVKMSAPSVKEYQTHQVCLDKILSYMKDDRVKGVRVYGELGTGKTVIMKNLNNHEDIAALFDIVLWVKVSDEDNYNFSIREMQEDIAKRLKIDIEGDLKGKISEWLSGKKYLLLLDGVNQDFKSDKIGISATENQGSKIVLTCRDILLCREMANRNVKVSRLTDPEANEMFQRFLGDPPRTSRVMKEVINYCSNIPYLIEKIAAAFINKHTEEEWEAGLNNLHFFPNKGDRAIQKVYKYVELFCNLLEGEFSDCFLYSALYPRESDINETCLLDCWTAENLCETRMYARHILDELKMRSYLQEGACGDGGECVKMEKYIWKVALDKLLADDTRRHLVNTGERLQYHQDDIEDWNQKHRISLVGNYVKDVPESPDSPMLLTLFLQKNRSLTVIPTFFFKNMGNLRVLNLQNTGIKSLPLSLRQLKNLKVFYLNGSTGLIKVPAEIIELSSLEVLDIRGTGAVIQQAALDPLRMVVGWIIPKSIRGEPSPGLWDPLPDLGSLSRLKRLLVSFNAFGEANEDEDVSRFCKAISTISETLEELVIDVNACQIYCRRMINDVRDEVATRTNLKLLMFVFADGTEEVIKVVGMNKKIYFPEPGDVEGFLNPNPNSFEVYAGCSISRHRTAEINQYYKYVKICNRQGSNGCTPRICEVISKFDALELANDDHHKHLSEFGPATFNMVQGCLIEGCRKIEAIVDGDDPTVSASPILPVLVQLYIKNLPMLIRLWKGPWKENSLVKLEILLIKDCSAIIELLPDPRISSKLQNLKTLILTNLQSLEKICTFTDSSWPALEELSIEGCQLLSELPFLPENAKKLKKLMLVNLSGLLRICANGGLMNWPALEELHVIGCSEISILPLSIDSTKSLWKLVLEDLNRLTTISTYVSLMWPMLEELEIKCCNALTKLPFSNNAAMKLNSIKGTQIWWDLVTFPDPEVKTRLARHFHPI